MTLDRWKRLFATSIFQRKDPSIRITLPGWTEAPAEENLRVWNGPHRAVLTVAYLSAYPQGVDEFSLVNRCRDIAKSRSAGLIEARILESGSRPPFYFIYKRLQHPAYVYTGIHVLWRAVPLQCTVVAGECSPTGVREAVVSANMLNSGEIKNAEDYERIWAHDPYDPSYNKVDRSVLRFISDDESYDEQFPEHPLSRVRNILRALPACLTFD